MKTTRQIQLNYRQALNQANTLDNLANQVDRVAKTDLENSMQSLSKGWKGDNATAFLTKERVLKGKISGTAKEIRQVASDIRTVARTIYRAEMEAVRIANKRES